MPFLKDIAKRLPYPLFLRLFSAYDGSRRRKLADEANRRAGIPTVGPEAFAAAKRSDTLVVLGSGPSINRLPESAWPALARYDTVGLNFWLFHPFVPRFYLVEAIPQRTWPEEFQACSEIARERAADYRETSKFVSETETSDPLGVFPFPDEWRGRVATFRTAAVPARSVAELACGLEYLRSRGVFEPDVPLFFKQASTLSFAVALAAKLRYRRIVLLGVDLTTSDYFYQDAARYPRWAALRFLDPAAAHPTGTTMLWYLPVTQVLLELKRLVLDPLGIELFVENPDSALRPHIPLLPRDFLAP